VSPQPKATDRGETGSVAVTLKDGLGNPIAVPSRLAVAPAADTPGRQRKAAGRAGQVTVFRLELPVGNYVVEAEAQGFKPASVTLSIRAGEESKRDIHLRPADPARPDRDEAEREARTLDGALAHFAEQRTGSREEKDFPADARERALEQKRRMGGTEASSPALRMTEIETPLGRVSFGSLEKYVQVSVRRGIEGPHILRIAYSDEDLSYVDPSTLRVFAIDANKRTATLVDASGVDTQNRSVFAEIERGGMYGVFGLPANEAVLETVRMFCRLGAVGLRRRGVQNRICELILCTPDNRDLPLPGGLDGNVCDHCTKLRPLEGGLPECELLDGPPGLPGPIGPGCNWLFIGPRNVNGRVRAMASHPTAGDTVFAGTANAGVWVTRDAGQSWQACMRDELALEIGALATHLTDPAVSGGAATVYAGTGEPTWWPGYRGVGVYKSTASGAPGSWVLCGAPPAPGNDRYAAIVVDPTSVTSNPATTVVYAGGTPGGLYRSSDGGATWTNLLAQPINGLALDPTNSNIVYAAVSNQGIFRLDPTAGTWSAFNAGLPAAVPLLVAIAIGRSAPHTMYCKLDEAVFRYDTATSTWQALGNHGGGTYGYWNMALGVDPNDSNVVYAGGFTFERTSDGGTTWTNIPGLHADQHAVCFDAANSLTAYLGNDGGVYRGEYATASGAGTWTKRSDGLLATQLNHAGVFPGTGDIVGGGTQDNGTLRTVGGLTWDELVNSDGGFLVIDPADPYILYAEDQNAGWMGKTTNGGQTWVGANSGFPGGPWVTPIVMDPASPPEPNRILFAGGNNGVYRSTNSAGVWTLSSPATGSVNAIAIAPSSSSVVYAGTLGVVWRSTDGGATTGNWTDASAGTIAGSTPLPARIVTDFAVHPSDPNTVWVTFGGFGGGHVFRGSSPDGWVTWRWDDVSSNLPDTPVNAIQVSPTAPLTLYAGTDVGVFRTIDGGVSWHAFDAGLPNVVVADLAIDAAGTALRAATYGFGMWEQRLTGTCPQVDVYMRDNIRDTAEVTPSPSGVVDPTRAGRLVYWWESADIKVDSYPYYPVDALFDGVEFDGATHEEVVRNDAAHPNPNRLYVQVHNRGPTAAHNVKVKPLWADASAGLPQLPSDFWSSYPNDWTAASAWNKVDPAVPFQNIPELLPHTPKVLSWSWTVPTTAAAHTCMLVVVSADEDPITRSDAVPDDLNPGVVVPGDKHVTLRNLHVITAPAPPAGGAPMMERIEMHSPFGHEEFFDLEIDRTRLQEKARLSVILPRRITLRTPVEQLPQVRALTGREWFAKNVKLARREWAYHVGVSPEAADAKRPVTRVPGILVTPDRPVTIAMVLALPRGAKPGERSRLSVIQRRGDDIVGGSTYDIRVAPQTVVVR
jgi:hypothetical protein